ncbi:MAG: MATE family efflux transporter, partial [Proteobacteria bacterium]|nr:MATE family efflux transporter [Pseudomonadota bacterium]
SGLVIALLLALSGDFVPSLFSDHAEVTDVGTLFLMIVPISYGAYGMVMVMNASFNGMGKPMPAVHVSVGRMMLIYVPLAMITEKYFGITGVFVSYAVANIITGALSYVWARASVEEQCNRHGAPVVVSETI